MSGWKGVVNPDRHSTDRTGGFAYCADCWALDCSESNPCRCCLKAGLVDCRSANKALGERVFVAENALANVRDVLDNSSTDIAAELERAVRIALGDMR